MQVETNENNGLFTIKIIAERKEEHEFLHDFNDAPDKTLVQLHIDPAYKYHSLTLSKVR